MTITRRGFLAGAGALAASALGCRSPERRWDVCIIGSGFAGTFLGLRTAAGGLDTVILEAGTKGARPRRGAAGEFFKYRTSGEIDYSVNATRAIVVGGTSTLWGGVTTRLWPSDFRLQTEHGLWVDWPIGYRDLEPYWCEAEELLKTRGGAVAPEAEPPRDCDYPTGFEQSLESPAVEIEGAVRPFFRIARSKRNGRALRLDEGETEAFETHRLGTLLSDLQVTRIVTLDGTSIDHVEALPMKGGEPQIIRARYFVVAAGVIESARLLLMSRSQWFENGLGNQHGEAGRYFTVHPSYQTRFRTTRPINVGGGQFRTCALNDDYRRRGLNATQFQLDVQRADDLRWRVQPEIEPQSDNRVTLSGATDSRGVPFPDIRLTYSDRDRETFRRCRAFLDETRADLGAVESTVRDHDRWRAHPSGTCRMGFDPTNGVVDADNRVFGLSNLFVSGASTFPTAGTANPTNTVVAMTLRLGDHLLRLA